MSIFEIIMLICFGAAWPFSIYRSAKARSTKGKSLLFMLVVATGYVAGIANKLVYNFDGVVYLYVLDLVLVSTDIALFARNRRLERRGEGAAARPGSRASGARMAPTPAGARTLPRGDGRPHADSRRLGRPRAGIAAPDPRFCIVTFPPASADLPGPPGAAIAAPDAAPLSLLVQAAGPIRGLCYDGRTVSGKDALCSSQSTSHVPRCPKRSTSRVATRSWRSSWCCSRKR